MEGRGGGTSGPIQSVAQWSPSRPIHKGDPCRLVHPAAARAPTCACAPPTRLSTSRTPNSDRFVSLRRIHGRLRTLCLRSYRSIFLVVSVRDRECCAPSAAPCDEVKRAVRFSRRHRASAQSDFRPHRASAQSVSGLTWPVRSRT